jgi:hypothetical protein
MTVDEMNAKVAAGAAGRLFRDDPIGPVLYRQSWWAVVGPGAAFEPVRDPTVVVGLDRVLARLYAAGLPTAWNP